MWGVAMDTNRDPKKAIDRRQVLKIAAGGAAVAILLPRQWTKPLVNAVIVPAHATASAPPTTTTTTTTSIIP
jgi:hypothetical protein